MPDQSPLKPQGSGFSSRYDSVPGGQSQSQYDRGSYLAEIGDLNAVRARNQGFWDGLGNTGVNILSTVSGQAISAIGSLLDPMYEWLAGEELAWNEGITGTGLEIQNAGQSNFPIYYDPKKGFNADYIMSHIPSVASTLSMLLPGYGVARGAGTAARIARLGALGETIAGTVAGSVAMRHAENWMEASHLYDQIMKEGAMGTNEAFDLVTNEQIQNSAKVAALTTYKTNWSNLVFDMMQLGAILKPVKGLAGWTNTLGKESRFAQVMDYGYKTAIEKGLLSEASSLAKFGLRSAAFMRPLLLQSTEGIEEAVNYVAEQEGRRDGMLAAGQPDDGTTFEDRLGQYLGNNELWDSFTWGLIGGVIFQKGGEMLNRAGAKAGWWEDTTQRGQMLADLKNRSDIITRGYKQLSDPKLTEYDKEAVKASMLFDLVSSNKSKESLDMLEEDLKNPAMVKQFASLMGVSEQEAQKEIPQLLEDISYINDKLDQYTGSTLSSWAGSDPERITTGLDTRGEQTTTANAIGPTVLAKFARKVPFITDPKVSMLLANNDYRVHVQERLNKKAQTEMNSIRSATFTDPEKLDANAQAVFNMMAEIAALESIVQQEQTTLNDRKAKGLPDSYIAASNKRLGDAEASLGRRKKDLDTLKTTMEEITASEIPGTSFKEAQDFALSALGKGGQSSKYASLKHMYFLNQLDKNEQLAINREVLTDPAKYMEDMIVAFKADEVFRKTQADQKAQAEEEQRQLDKIVADLIADGNEEFQKMVKENNDAIETTVAGYTSPEAKMDYLNKELAAVNQEIDTATNDGQFARSTPVEYSNKFNKNLYQQLKARQKALTEALAPYQKSSQQSSNAANQTGSPAGVTKKPSVVKDKFEVGTPPYVYQGMVKMFGTDGNGGAFNNTYFANAPGVLGNLQAFQEYPAFIEGITKVLDGYNRAKAAKDPNAANLLNEANPFVQTGRDLFAVAGEQKKLAEVQQELEYLQEKYQRAIENLTATKPSESKPWQGIARGGYADKYPDAYKFAVKEIDTYPNNLAVAENIETIKANVVAELQRTKDASDQWLSGNAKPVKQEGPVNDDKLDEAMDQTQESQTQIADFPETDTVSESGQLYPASHAESVLKHNDNWEFEYTANGKTLANPLFGMGNTIFIGKGNKTQNGFVNRGKQVKMQFTGKFRGKNEYAEKEVVITDMDGNLIGYLDTANRLKKSIATLKKKQPKTEKKKAKIERTIAKYNELIPYYNKLRNQLQKTGDTLLATVADQVSQVEGGVNSGGITIGSTITTKRDKDGRRMPLALDAAFDIATLNRSNKDTISPTYLAVYYNGSFSTKLPNSSQFEDVTKVHPKISIPSSVRNVQTLSGKGTNNGAVFAVIPTNVFDQENNRIYLPFKLSTASVTNINLTDNGSSAGKTIPEAMLDVMVDPDGRRQEFEALAGRIGIKFKKEFPITAKENRERLLSFFTTDNLLSLFNSVTYVYDGKEERKSQIRIRDYSHHIGIDIFEPKAAKEKGISKPSIRFDLSNDITTKNTFVVNLFDDEGNFAPYFGKKKVTASQTLSAEERAANPNLNKLEAEVDVRDSINRRFRQKLFRVDKALLGRTSDSAPYRAIIFEAGKIVEKEYPSYLHFLNEKQILESTIHGINYQSIDPVTGDSQTGRTYFTDQAFWFDMNAEAEKAPNSEPTANRNTTQQPLSAKDQLLSFRRSGGLKAYDTIDFTQDANVEAALQEIAEQANTNRDNLISKGYPASLIDEALRLYPQKPISKDPGVINTRAGFAVPDAIRTSIGLRQDGIITRKEGKDSHYIINGQRYERVSTVLKGAGKEAATPSTAAGNLVDSFAKAVIYGEPGDRDGFSENAYNDLTGGMEAIRDYLASKGQRIVNTDVVVYGTIRGLDGQSRNIAGEVDLLTVDTDGNLYVYDFKTSKAPFDLQSYQKVNPKTGSSRYDDHLQQLSTYGLLIQNMTGKAPMGIGVIPITVDYTTTGRTVNINNVVPYDVVIFEDYEYVPGVGQANMGTGSPIADNLDDLTDDEIDGMNLDNDDPTRPTLYMADSPQAREAAGLPPSPYSDPSRFRDHSRTYPDQKQYENYTAQIMLDILYNHRVTEGRHSQLTYNEILERVREDLDKRMTTYRKIIKSGGVYTKTRQIPYTQEQINGKQKQLFHMQELRDMLDHSDMKPGQRQASQDFVGYGRMGIVKLSGMGIIRTDIIEEEINVSGPADLPYSVRYQENYAFKINPKTTINTEAKIFLSRIPELDSRFRAKANLFGMNNYYPVDDVIAEMHIEFENTPPERFMERLQELDTRIPIIKSTVQTISKVSLQNEDKGNQVRNQLSTLIKQRRDMKYLKADIDEETGKVTARIIDAARQGISQNIIQTWEDGFRQRFQDLFSVEEQSDDIRSSSIKATPKKRVFNVPEKGKAYDQYEFSLPADFDVTVNKVSQQTEWLYGRLKAIAAGNKQYRVAFTFEGDRLKIGKTLLSISKNDVAQLLLSVPSDNIVLDSKTQSIFTNERYLKDTQLDQIGANLAYFLKKPGVYSGNTDQQKDKNGYYPIYYQIMADQLNALGIQLSEDTDTSWRVLEDLNTSMDRTGQRRRFHQYDPRATDFDSFLTDKVNNLIIAPLLKPGAFNTSESQYMTEDAADFGQTARKIDVENPFSHSLQGINPLAKHARLYWYSYANETIRNTNGDLEYTYTSQNGLSTMMSKLKDANGGYLSQVAETPMGRNNLFIRNLLNSPTALEDFTLHYVDGGKVNNIIKLLPEDANAGRANMLLWNLYYNNETRTAQRNKGGFMTTHSDSSIMPVMMFDKQVLGLDFIESIDEGGTRSYTVNFQEFMPDGTENAVWQHLYGIFRGELQRIYEGYQAWMDIQAQPAESRLQYAIDNYQLHFHYRVQGDRVVRGNATNMYLFGNTMYEGNGSGIYNDESKTGLKKIFFDSQGNANESTIKQHFAEFINRYANELIGDAYADLMSMGNSFFQITETRGQGIGEGDTKTIRLDLKLNMINSDSAAAMKVLFNKHAGIITDEGRENVETRNTRIEKYYSLNSLVRQGMTEAQAKDFIAQADRTRQEDIKASTYTDLQLRYMVADLALNNSIFLGSLFQMMLDPAIFEKGHNYKGFREDFEKRMKGPVSPGEVNNFNDNEQVKVVGFKDLTLGHIKTPLDVSQFSNSEQEFFKEFARRFKVEGNNFPSRVLDLMPVYFSRPVGQRESAWADIASILRSKVTDGGSYISVREWLYRLYRRGQISAQDYFDGVNYFKDKSGKQPAPAKVMKYVYAGNNIIDTGNSSSNIYSYLKHAETPLLPGIHTGTALDEIRKQIDQIEEREYAGVDTGQPLPGIIAVPESSFKTGFNFTTEIFNPDGSLSDQLVKSKVLTLNRGWLREQIQAPDDSEKRTMISTQANVLTDLDIPADFRFGQRGPITFSRMQEGDVQIEVDENGNEIEIEEPGTGISSGAVQSSVVKIFTELAERRFQDQIQNMGLNKNETEYMVSSVNRFIGRMKEQAISRFGVGANAVDYLSIINELENGDILSIPITFTPATRKMQSVFLADIKGMFYRFTLPGGAFSQFSAAGLYQLDKGKMKADTELKSYRLEIKKSKTYTSEQEAMKHFHPNEIHSPYNPATKTLEYYDFTPGEAVLPWIFKGKDGKLLNYDEYVNADGTPKQGRIDSRLLDFVAFRIPNTGPNASARLRAVRFMRPEMGDGIAVAPEIIAILGADFDYDKLYSYLYNYNVTDTGILTKVESILHESQNGSEDFFVSDNQKREFAKRQLSLTDTRYRQLVEDQRLVRKGVIDLEKDYNDMIGELGKMNWEQFAQLRNKVSSLDPENLQKELTLAEDNYMRSGEFETAYGEATIYEKQSVASLENALIDRFNLMLGDFKMLHYMTNPLTSDWLEDQVNGKLIPYYEGSEKRTASITELLHDRKFHSITSYNTFLQSRLSNTAAGSLIGMGANALISQYQGQRWNLSMNGMAYAAEVQPAYTLLFKDRTGNIKQEDETNRSNSSYAGRYSPYVVKKRGDYIYAPPADGRWRFDRIYTKTDNGQQILVSTPIKATLQASLDHLKNPLVDKASINPITFNAVNAMIRLGYVNEAIPLINQESVATYVKDISGYYDLQAAESRTAVMLRITSDYAQNYGVSADRVAAIYKGLDPEHKNGAVLITAVLADIAQRNPADQVLSTADLLFGIAQRAGVAPMDAEYGIRQLVALRNYLVADIYGRQLFNVQQGTSAYAKGLKSSFAETDLQERRFNALFKYKPRTNQVESSAPLIAGLHRINYAWSLAVGRPFDFRPTMMGYGQYRGVRPTIQLLNSVQGNVFMEFSRLFTGTRRSFFLTSMGTDISKSLEGISNPEYIRVFNKINTNLVSYFFSNPELYRNLFPTTEEYDTFVQYGMEMLTRPRKDLPFNPQFALFNTAESLAKNIERVSAMTNPVTGNEYGIDYDILAALNPIFNVSYKTPSSVTYMNASGYQENLNHRLAMSMAEMYRSSDPQLKSLIKKLIIYGFMTGGVTTPTSFVQFIPPSLIRDMGFDTVLRKALAVSQKPELINESIKSFMIQYFQHHPFELQYELGNDYLVATEDGVEQVDKNLGRIVIQKDPAQKAWFAGKFIFRRGSKLYVHHPTDDNYLMMIDNLGMNKWHRNEYRFNFGRIPGNSLYLHNISESSRMITDGIEIKGDFTAADVQGDPEVDRLMRRLETPMFNKLVEKPQALSDVIEAIQIDNTNATAGSVLTFLKPIVQDAQIDYVESAESVSGYYETGTSKIAVNTLYRNYKGLLTGVPGEFDNSHFAGMVAHEASHMATAQVIEDVLTGKEKDPAKVQAVTRLKEVHARSMDYIAKHADMRGRHQQLVKFKQITDKIVAGRKPSAADIEFLRTNRELNGFYTVAPGDSKQDAEIRQLQEFVAYSFADEALQKDLNKIDMRKGKTIWQELIQAILKLLGLNISEEEAQLETTKIKKRLAPRQPIVNMEGVPDSRRNEISETLRDLQPYSALHVALREIIELGTIVKREGINTAAFAAMRNKLTMSDMYQGVNNFDPGWSEEMKKLYHEANLNQQIIC